VDDNVRAFFDAPNFCHVSTLKDDGSVHAVIVWVHTEGERIVLNSADGRDWPANLRRDPRVTLVAADVNDPRNFARIAGRYVGEDHDNAEAHIDFLANKYEGTSTYPYRVPGEIRVKLFIEPEESWVFIGGSRDSQIRPTGN
jgi:PPOX class probable F420-dependent enzyme